jgi:uncharacterized membrane protein YwzB
MEGVMINNRYERQENLVTHVIIICIPFLTISCLNMKNVLKNMVCISPLVRLEVVHV